MPQCGGRLRGPEGLCWHRGGGTGGTPQGHLLGTRLSVPSALPWERGPPEWPQGGPAGLCPYSPRVSPQRVALSWGVPRVSPQLPGHVLGCPHTATSRRVPTAPRTCPWGVPAARGPVLGCPQGVPTTPRPCPAVSPRGCILGCPHSTQDTSQGVPEALGPVLGCPQSVPTVCGLSWCVPRVSPQLPGHVLGCPHVPCPVVASGDTAVLRPGGGARGGLPAALLSAVGPGAAPAPATVTGGTSPPQACERRVQPSSASG